MSRASGAGQSAGRRERIAAQRAAQRRRDVRNRVLIVSGAVVVILVIVIVFVVAKVSSKSPASSASSASNGPTGAALAKVIAATTSVPASTLAQVGAGSVSTPPAAVSGAPLTSGGKPEMLYIGAEYCPYCAFERWGMIVSLSRFGSFSGLRTIHSSSTDVYPNTPTWTFYKSTYTSKYVTFTPVEETTNVPDKNSPAGYVPLQTPTPAQQALLSKYNPGGSIPFVNFGNKYVITGASASALGAGRQELGHDRRRAEGRVQPGGAGRQRHRQLHDGGDLQDDQQPARERVHAVRDRAAGQDGQRVRQLTLAAIPGPERAGRKGEGRPAPDGWRTEPALPHRGCPCPAFRRGGRGAAASPRGVTSPRGSERWGGWRSLPPESGGRSWYKVARCDAYFRSGGEERRRRPPVRGLKEHPPVWGSADRWRL